MEDGSLMSMYGRDSPLQNDTETIKFGEIFFSSVFLPHSALVGRIKPNTSHSILFSNLIEFFSI